MTPPDLLDGRSEATAAEYLEWLAGQGSPTTAIPPVPLVAVAPDWRTNEKKFLQRVVDVATDHGWLVYHTWNSANSSPGFCDLVLVRDRCLIFAELKIRPNKPTAAQRRWLEALDLAGAETYVWYPDQWDAIEVVLR